MAEVGQRWEQLPRRPPRLRMPAREEARRGSRGAVWPPDRGAGDRRGWRFLQTAILRWWRADGPTEPDPQRVRKNLRCRLHAARAHEELVGAASLGRLGVANNPTEGGSHVKGPFDAGRRLRSAAQEYPLAIFVSRRDSGRAPAARSRIGRHGRRRRTAQDDERRRGVISSSLCARVLARRNPVSDTLSGVGPRSHGSRTFGVGMYRSVRRALSALAYAPGIYGSDYDPTTTVLLPCHTHNASSCCSGACCLSRGFVALIC